MPDYTNNHKKLSRKRRGLSRLGFTLIELLVAVAIGGMVMAMTAQMFQSNMRAFSLIDQLQNMEINGRVAIDFMGRDIRSAGMGMGGGDPLFAWDNSGNTVDGTAYATLANDLTAKNGTDIIEIFNSLLAEPIVIPNFNAAAANVTVTSTGLVGLPGFSTTLGATEIDNVLEPYSVMFYECAAPSNRCTQNITSGQFNGAGNVNTRVIFNRGTCDGAAVANLDTPFEYDTMLAWLAPSSAFAAGPLGGNDCANRPHDCAALGGLTVCAVIGSDIYYYVYDDPADAENPKLVRYNVGQAREVIANYVEDFQLVYGEDTNNDGTISTAEWNNAPANVMDIRLAKISLMVKTKDIDGRKTAEVPQVLENSTIPEIGIANQYRRRVISRTIRLRNAGN